MQTLHFTLLGKLKIYGEYKELIPLDAQKAQELLSYLLLYRDRLHEREKLATLLWGETTPVHSKQYLRQTLWYVQSKLNLPALSEPLLVVDHHQIGINPQAKFSLDVATFEQTFTSLEHTPGASLSLPQMEQLRQTVALYQGDLLEGWYQDWCIYERDRYQNIYLAMLDKLLSYSEVQHEYESGLAYGWQILHYDRAREATHRRLMRLHYGAGNRTAAIQQYHTCVAALAEELGVGPAKSTLALYEQICADGVAGLASPQAEISTSPESPAPEPPLPLQQLERIQKTLTQLQAQVIELVHFFEQSNSTSF